MGPKSAEPVGGGAEIPGQRPAGAPTRGGVEGVCVGVDPGRRGNRQGPQREGHDEPSKRVSLLDREATEGRSDEATPPPDEGTMVERPSPRVKEHEALYRARVAKSVGEADGSPPVVEHQSDIVEIEVGEQQFKPGGMSRRAVRAVGRGCGSTEAQEVGGNAPVLRRKGFDEVPVEVSARGVSVYEHYRGAASHVGVRREAGGRTEGLGAHRGIEANSTKSRAPEANGTGTRSFTKHQNARRTGVACRRGPERPVST